jgi:hypothetical protein
VPTVVFSSRAAAIAELLALMTYPDDEDARALYLLIGPLAQEAERVPGQSFMLNSRDLLAILRACPLDQMRADQRERTKRGFVAGGVLATLYLLHRFQSESHYFEPTMRRAIFVAQEVAKGKVAELVPGALGRFGDGSRMPTSESTIKDAWRTFGRVSPFWGAIRIASLGYPYAPEKEIFSNSTHFARFLEVANALHRFGTTFVPERAKQRVPLLDPKTTYAPPVGTSVAELKSERVPDVLKRLLQRYRAPAKKR